MLSKPFISIFLDEKDNLQTIKDHIRLRSQKKASTSDNTMAKRKGLDKIKVNLTISSVKFMWSNPIHQDD
jgi:hypothetical protein